MTKFAFRSKIFPTVALCALLAVSGCALTENYLKADRDTNSNIQDYRDYLAPREAPLDDQAAANDVPALQPYIADNSENMKAMPLVSISINQTIPLRDALFELAKQANYDVQLDPRITGSVIFTARNRPFDVVIEQLCDVAGLRYSFNNDILRVELDTPYTKTYKVGYLSLVRSNESNIKTNVTVGGSGGGGGGGEGESGSTAETTTGSEFSIESSSESDFWKELDTNLKQILESNSSLTYLKTDTDPAISVSTASTVPPVPPIDEAALQGGTPAPEDIAPQAGGTSIKGKTGVFPQIEPTQVPAAAQPANAVAGDPNAAPPSAPAANSAENAAVPTPTAAQPAAATQPAPTTATPQETVLQVQSLPTGEGAQSANQNAVGFKPSFAINKQAGLVTVFASERIHKRVKEYLDKLEKTSTQQVLIEAKVLEVELNDEFAAGIDWDYLSSSSNLANLGMRTLSFNGGAPALTPAETTSLSVEFSQGDFTAAISALSRFGTTRALASPRLTVLNNQPAVLNVAQNRVYFEIKSERESSTTTSPAVTTFTTTAKNVPEGVLINVLPSVDAETNTVSMQIRPTVTRITGFVNDPGIALNLAPNPVPAGVSNQVPVVNVKEMDSIVRMKSKETIVMGGLLEDRSTGTQRGIPVAGEVPIVGALFRSQGDQVRKTELVIFIKATILSTAGESVHNTDRELYRVYGQDRRPFRM
jgi:MSHA biogenesis protein MshL